MHKKWSHWIMAVHSVAWITDLLYYLFQGLQLQIAHNGAFFELSQVLKRFLECQARFQAKNPDYHETSPDNLIIQISIIIWAFVFSDKGLLHNMVMKEDILVFSDMSRMDLGVGVSRTAEFSILIGQKMWTLW